ncbi:MAG: hypothetical protein OIF58_11165 [Cohaesibacter sp.]|nr:hypothetical protein [Cohaesibacter sp.]
MALAANGRNPSTRLAVTLDEIDLALDLQKSILDAMSTIANENLSDSPDSPTSTLYNLLHILRDYHAQTVSHTATAHKTLRTLRCEEVAL